MATKSDFAAANLYQDLMVELKARAESINAVTGLSATIPAPLLREYGYLQLRMMCELIALGCLVAHGDIPATHTKSFQKAYDPADIFRKLEALHPDFYPVPIKPEKTPDGWHFDQYDKPYLTKSELIRLYGKCGDVLHKGSVRKLLNGKVQPVVNFDDINEWGQKLLNLVSSHRIGRIGNKLQFIVLFSLTGQAQVAIGEAIEPALSERGAVEPPDQ